ncbi:MAG: MotA/TolQ/ExbB proton channel family protein, partial [Acidiferrobacterales bacterium]
PCLDNQAERGASNMTSVLKEDETRRPVESTTAKRHERRFKDRSPKESVERYQEASPSPSVASLSDTVAGAEKSVPTGERVMRLFAVLGQRTRDPYQYLLLLRFALLNLVAFALLGAAYVQGLVDMVVAADRTYLSVVIFFVFVGGLGLCGWKIWQTSHNLNSVRAIDTLAQLNTIHDLARLLRREPSELNNLINVLRLRLSHRIAIVRHIANTLVILGLIGTVLGFIIALSGVDPEHASDISAIAPMVSTLISGMSTALYTTLVGAVLNVWLMANHQLLAGGTVKLIAAVMELTDGHARS